MSEILSPARRTLMRFERKLRLGVLLWSAAVALALSAGTAAAGLGLGSAVVGLAPSPWLSGACWLATGAAAFWMVLRFWGRTPRMRGPAVTEVLRRRDPGLASDARSALELTHQPEGSGELIEALLESVDRRVQPFRPAELTRPEAPDLKLAAATLLGGVLLLSAVSLSDRGQAGLYALTHPFWSGDAREGVWVDHFELRVDPPAHTGLPTRHYRNPRRVAVHAGSRLALRVEARLPITRARISIGDLELPLHPDGEDRYHTEWVAEASGPLHFEGYDDGWLRDARSMTLGVITDQVPRAVMESPEHDLHVRPSERVRLKFHAHDDHGLSGIDLIVRGPGSQEHRQRVAAPESGERRRGLSGEMVLRASDFGVRPGDTLSLWLEATDLNQHVGPQVGHSTIRTLSVDGGETEQGAAVQSLMRAREQALALLADRLENEVPGSDRAARASFGQREADTRTWLQTLAAAAEDVGADTADLLRDMQQRVRDQLGQERKLYQTRGSLGPRRRARERAVVGLEGDTLWLADLLARARIEDAEAVLKQIHQAEERMRGLLEELAGAPDEARKQALMAEIARMRAKLSELMAKLRDVRGTVPAEFVNREAMKAAPQQDALSKLEKAVDGNDLEDARAALDALSQQLSQLEQGLGETGVALSTARFAPRNETTQDTLRQLSQLEQQQRALAEKTDEVGRRAATRGGSESSARSQASKLADQAQSLAQKLGQLGTGPMSGAMAESRAAAEQRLRDVGDALSGGDFYEGERMARSAESELRGLSRELEMDARMFPGPDGQLQEVARDAERLRQRAQDLARQVADAAPDLDKLLQDDDRRDVKQQSGPQSELARDTHAAREKLSETQGDDGVSAGAADRLGDVEDAMRRASKSLKEGKLRDAQAHQRDAMQRMAQLREDLGRQAQAGTGQPGNGQTRVGGDGDEQSKEHVDIPEDSDANRRSALRRRVLDAQRGEVPPGFEGAVQRYYEEILR